jgi:hypothetical protein
MANKTKHSKITNKHFTKSNKVVAQTSRHNIVSVWQLSKNSSSVVWNNRSLFSGIMLVYGILYLLLVQGLSSAPSSSTNFSHGLSRALSGLASFALLVNNSSTSSNPAGGPYQAILIIIVSLVLIWTLRQIYAGSKVRIRDGYYKALYPFIPFLLILLLIGLEFLPLLIGTTIYSVVISQGIAVNVIEKLIGLIFLLGLILLSLYLISSSVFALYIVTLPDMTPMKALRSAKELVKGRRSLIMRKLLFLPLALIILTSLIMLPFILIYAPSAPWVLFILSLGVIVMVHSYLYNLYRELIR